MNNATVIAELSYENPADPPVYEDETAYLRGWKFTRGRPHKLEPFGAGYADVRFDNSTGRFSPTYNAGPHYPNVLPMRRLRLSADVESGVDAFTVGDSFVGDVDALGGGVLRFPLFSGFIEAWPQEWPLNGFDSEVSVRAVDGTKVFNLTEFIWGVRYTSFLGVDTIQCGLPTPAGVVPATGPPWIPDDLSGERINRVLDCIDWPSDERDVDDGTVTILGSDRVFGGTANIPVTGGTALSHMQDVTLAEGGFFFMDAAGRARFADSTYEGRYSPGDIWSIEPGLRHYAHNSLEYDEQRIVNVLTVASSSPDIFAGRLVSDATSIDHYYPRDGAVTMLPNTADLDARAAALLAERSEPVLHSPNFVPLELSADDTVAIITRELLDRIRVQELRPDPADMSSTLETIDMECRIEQISMSQQTTELHPWEFSWVLSVTEL